MTQRLLRSTLGVLAALVIIIAGASLAKADDPLWIFAKCGKGGFTTAQNGGEENVVVLGSAAFCGLHILNSSFGVAVYRNGQQTTTVLSSALRKFPLLGSRAFSIEVSDDPGVFGVCLVASTTIKIACGRVEFDESGYVEFTTIQPTDALVNARITGSEIAVDPRCGACF
jgi:hypothetical protein